MRQCMKQENLIPSVRVLRRVNCICVGIQIRTVTNVLNGEEIGKKTLTFPERKRRQVSGS